MLLLDKDRQAGDVASLLSFLYQNTLKIANYEHNYTATNSLLKFNWPHFN
jgi:hypothetical protein